MPSGQHEAVIELFEVDSDLLADVLRKTSGLELPDFDHVGGSSETANIKLPVEHRADSVRAFYDADNNPVLVTVVEVQLAKKESKQWVWPVFVTEARRLHKCETVVLVIVPDGDTATWARRPLDLGMGRSFVTPLVLDISELDVFGNIAEAEANIGLAVIATLNPKTPPQSLDIISAALARKPADEAKQYAGLMLSALREAPQEYWRKLMTAGTYAYQNDYARELKAEAKAEGRAEGREEGKVEGQAELLLFALNDRGIAIPGKARERIETCEDAELFKTWLHRTMRATTIDDVFGH